MDSYLVYRDVQYTKVMTLWKDFDCSIYLKLKFDKSVTCAKYIGA